MTDIHATIERLLNMTVANGASIQEAETAASVIRKLLDKHGMTVEEVRSRRAGGHGIHHEDTEVAWEQPPVWAVNLAVEIAAGFDCRVGGGAGLVRFIGFPPEPAVAGYLFRVLSRELPVSADNEGRFLRYRGQELREWKNSFLVAAALRIGARLRDARQRNSGTAALIVCKQEAIDELFGAAFKGKCRKVGARIRDEDGALRGDAAGRRACLDARPLPAPPRQRPLGFLTGGNA